MWPQVTPRFCGNRPACAGSAAAGNRVRPIFNGSSLDGWDFDPDFWRATGGSIVGETTAAHQPKQNTFCIWKGGSPADFDLKLLYRIGAGGSGIQYRSVELPNVAKWVMKGYQADIDAEQMYTGQVYEERECTFLALRGQAAYEPASGKPGANGTLGDAAELKNTIKTTTGMTSDR